MYGDIGSTCNVGGMIDSKILGIQHLYERANTDFKDKGEMAMTGTKYGQSKFIVSIGNQSFLNAFLIENSKYDQIVVLHRTSWKYLFAYRGLGFLVSMVYVDLGNFETNFKQEHNSSTSNFGAY